MWKNIAQLFKKWTDHSINMEISSKAVDYVKKQVKELEEPILVVFQQVYRGWCGTEVVTNVAPADKSQIKDDSAFSIKNIENFNIPLYLDKRVTGLWGRSKIDLAGWSSFKRLVLLEL